MEGNLEDNEKGLICFFSSRCWMKVECECYVFQGKNRQLDF
jgi:hypothetical protein